VTLVTAVTGSQLPFWRFLATSQTRPACCVLSPLKTSKPAAFPSQFLSYAFFRISFALNFFLPIILLGFDSDAPLYSATDESTLQYCRETPTDLWPPESWSPQVSGTESLCSSIAEEDYCREPVPLCHCLWAPLEGFGVLQLHCCSAICGYCSTPEPAPVKLRFGSFAGSTSCVVYFGFRFSFRLYATVQNSTTTIVFPVA